MATLRAVLSLEIFRRGDAFIAAGGHLLERPVRWVHAGEISDIARFLHGGELLLTAGQGIGPSWHEQRDFVASIAKVGIAALAVELVGRVYDDFPPGLIAAAEEFSVPLIGLRDEIPFVEASAQVMKLLSSTAMADALRTVEANERLTAGLTGGADPVELVRTLSKSVGRPVVLESADGQMQASYGAGVGSTEGLTSNWAVHSEATVLHRTSGQSPPQCLRRPVVVQGAVWGYLHMSWDEQCNHTDQVIVESGASAVAISLLSERVSGARSRHQQGVLISRLIAGDISGPSFVDRALRFGRDLRRSGLAVVVAGTADDPSADLERGISGELKQAQIDHISADIGDAVLSVVALRSEKILKALHRAIADETRHIGVSRLVESEELPAAVQQARAAFLAQQPFQLFDDLGIMRLLVPLSRSGELAGYVDDELGALLEYDSGHGTELFRTLQTFLRCDGNKTTAADALFVQRRTLYYRLEKIEKITGLDLEQSDDRLRLHVAVRGFELLHDRRLARARTVREGRAGRTGSTES